MRFLSVCSGIEAASVAWNPLGWKAVAFSEIEPFPCAVLAHHYPDTPNWGDMTQYKEWPDVSIDLLCGGTPCQSFSVAGLRKGLDDPRGNLMLTYGAIAAKYRPKWLVWENVPGVLSSNGGRDFGTFLGMLGQLGYGFAYRVLDAQFFGVAQRRRRVFVVGCLGDWRSAAAVLFERHSLQGHPAPSRKAGKASPTIPSRSTAGGGLGTDFDCDGGLVAGTSQPYEVANCLTARMHKGINSTLDEGQTPVVTHSLRGEGFDASEDGTGRGTPLVPVHVLEVAGTMKACKDSGGWSNSADHAAAGHVLPVAFVQNSRDEVRLMGGDGSLVGALAAETGAKQQCYIAAPLAFPANLSATQHASAENISPSLGALNPTAVAFNMHKSGNEASSLGISEDRTDCLRAFEKSPFAVQPSNGMMVRRLTPEECEALQGFPRGYTRIAWRNKPADQCPDGPRYKAIGNSWATTVAHWIGRRIEAVEATHAQAREAA